MAVDERARADRFHFAKDQHRFIVRRVILRQILGAYTQSDPSEIHFAYDEFGKPSLMPTGDRPPIEFNASHSGDFALIGVTLDRSLGVDIERVRPEFVHETIPEQFFATSEVEAMRALPLEHQVPAFFHCWTRKEAYIKAIGKGLSEALDRFAVSLRPEDPAEILTIQGNPKRASAWSLHAFSPAEDYVAAVAIADKSYVVCYWEWSPTES